MTKRVTRPSNNKLTILCQELTALLRRPAPRTVCGVRLLQLLGRARRVKLAVLPHEDKVQLSGEQVLLDSRYVGTVYDPTDERRRADCALYFLHELTHLAQGIGQKAMVRRLRGTGGEQTLLHCDLHADHVAAGLLHRLQPHWSVPFLKEVQGQSLCAFPATVRHTKAAQQRKRMRVIAVRADYWARRLGLLAAERIEDGYLYVEYTKPKGALLLVRSGPPLAVLGEVRLGVAEVAALGRVNNPRRSLPLSQLDELLIHTLRRLRRPRT